MISTNGAAFKAIVFESPGLAVEFLTLFVNLKTKALGTIAASGRFWQNQTPSGYRAQGGLGSAAAVSGARASVGSWHSGDD